MSLSEEDRKKLENLVAMLRDVRRSKVEFLREHIRRRELLGNRKGNLTGSYVEERIRTAECIDKYELVIHEYDIISHYLYKEFPELERQE